jgi:hypothetical protein
MPRGGKRVGAGHPPAPGETFRDARRRKESALADLRQLEVRVRRDQLVERALGERSGAAWSHELLQDVLGIPVLEADNVAEALAAAPGPHTALRELERICRALAERLAARAFRMAADAERGMPPELASA